MKKLAILIFVLLLLVGCSPSEEDMAAAVAQTVEAMATDTPETTATPEIYPVITEGNRKMMEYQLDEISGWATIDHVLGQNEDLHSVIIAGPDGELDLRFLYVYVADDWLFIDSILINADGERYTLDLCFENTDTIGGGKIQEMVAVCLDLADKDMVAQITSADKVMARLYGSKGSHDFELNQREKTSLKYTFQTFVNLKEGTIEIKEGIESEEEVWWELP